MHTCRLRARHLIQGVRTPIREGPRRVDACSWLRIGKMLERRVTVSAGVDRTDDYGETVLLGFLPQSAIVVSKLICSKIARQQTGS